MDYFYGFMTLIFALFFAFALAAAVSQLLMQFYNACGSEELTHEKTKQEAFEHVNSDEMPDLRNRPAA